MDYLRAEDGNVWVGSEPGAFRGAVVTIGNFDGVHVGHRALLSRARDEGRARGAPAVALTFDPAPRDVLRPDNGIPRIQSLERKLVHLRRHVDGVLVRRFDLQTAGMEPADFALHVLGEGIGVSGVVVGHDFRFGRGRRGDAALLRDVLAVPVWEVDAVRDAEGVVSSSRIRTLLAAGEVARAAELLGRPHELVGEVVPGDRRGRTIGFPTANLWPAGGLIPPNGVYAVRAEVDGAWLPGVANLGTRPTFDGQGSRLEVHLLDAALDLYGRTLVVALVARIREERRFASVEELVARIRRDADAARALL